MRILTGTSATLLSGILFVSIPSACTKIAEDADEGGGGTSGSTGGGKGGSSGASGSGGKGGSSGASGSGGSAGTGGEAGTAGTGGTGSELIECGDRDTTGALVVQGEVTTDQDWSDVVHVRGVVNVMAVTVRIAPGTRVLFDAQSSLEFGWNTRSATILAEGTESAPIRFCGVEDSPGFYDSVIVGSEVNPESVLRHVLISDAGAPDGAALVANGPVMFDHVQVRNSGGDGVIASDFGAGSQVLTVEGSARSPLVLTTPAAVSRVPRGGSLSDNPEPFARLAVTTIEQPIRFQPLDVPYLQDEDVDVYEVEAVFDPGVRYWFAEGRSLEVGFNTRRALLHVNGTAEAPVEFRGLEDTPGYWGWIRITASVDPASVVSEARILHGGREGQPALVVAAPVTLDGVELDSNLTGASLEAAGAGPSSTGLSVTRTSGPPLTVHPNALIAIPESGSFVGNDADWIEVSAGDYDQRGTVAKLDVPYRVRGNVQTLQNSLLTIQAGTTFLMDEGSVFSVAWNTRTATIDAVGTADAPIIFRGVVEQAGSWGGLVIGANVTADSRLEYVRIGHGGARAGAPANLILEAPISVRNSTFFTSSGYGIVKRVDDTSDYAGANTFDDVALGSVGTL